MNAESLLKEIRARAREFTPGQTPHVINMSLLPVSPEDVAFVNRSLGTGPVTMLSRGYGRCRITATRVRKVWLVQYFNLMDTLILNTIEITGMPEVAVAAPDDIEDTARRLEELAEWMAAAA
jgi:hydrogenase-1 operon protein HyaF